MRKDKNQMFSLFQDAVWLQESIFGFSNATEKTSLLPSFLVDFLQKKI